MLQWRFLEVNLDGLTQLEYSSEISPEGTLNGDLFIIGSGDPSIGSGKAGAASTASIAADYLDKIKKRRN